jgi:hypothetical protein
VADPDDLPDSLKKLVAAWQQEGASAEEIIQRLDQLELLAHEERLKLIELVSSSG